MKKVLGDTPKCLAPLWGKPFLEHILDKFDCNQVVLCTGKGNAKIETFLLRYSAYPFFGNASIEHDPDMLGTGGSLRKAIDSRREKENIFVLNGDTFVDADLNKAYIWHKLWNSKLTALCKPENINPNAHGFCIRYIARTEEGCQVGDLEASAMLAGAYIISPDAMRAVTHPGERCDLDRDILMRLINDKVPCFAYTKDIDFFDIGTPERYAEAQAARSGSVLFGKRGYELHPA